jgi:hypothetical protein
VLETDAVKPLPVLSYHALPVYDTAAMSYHASTASLKPHGTATQGVVELTEYMPPGQDVHNDVASPVTVE